MSMAKTLLSMAVYPLLIQLSQADGLEGMRFGIAIAAWCIHKLRMCVFTRGLWFCPSGAVIKHFTVRNVAGAWYIDIWDATQVSRLTWTVDRRYNKNINELSFTNQYMINVVNCTSRAAISMRWEPSNYQALSWHAFGTPTVDAWDYKQVVKELLGLTSSKYTHASVKVTCVVKIRSRRCSNDSYLNWGSSWISIL